MKNELENIIESGQLELFVLGALRPEENLLVESWIAAHPEIKAEVESIRDSLEKSISSYAITPPPTVKPMVFAMIDYAEKAASGRLIGGEVPLLSNTSTIEDFGLWLNAPEHTLPPNFHEFHAIVIEQKPEVITAIAWIQTGAPPEVHDQYIEKFMILEGTCEIVVGEEVFSLKEGDFLSIPLFKSHYLRVTSKTVCKVILQRVAA